MRSESGLGNRRRDRHHHFLRVRDVAGRIDEPRRHGVAAEAAASVGCEAWARRADVRELGDEVRGRAGLPRTEGDGGARRVERRGSRAPRPDRRGEHADRRH